MKVKELIALLNAMDGELPVIMQVNSKENLSIVGIQDVCTSSQYVDEGQAVILIYEG